MRKVVVAILLLVGCTTVPEPEINPDPIVWQPHTEMKYDKLYRVYAYNRQKVVQYPEKGWYQFPDIPIARVRKDFPGGCSVDIIFVLENGRTYHYQKGSIFKWQDSSQ